MKIDNSLKSVGSPAGDTRTGKSNGNAAAAGKPQAGVSVELSDLSTQLQSLETRLAGAEVADPARVAEIKQAIAEGRFAVNPDVVADRLLQTVRDLIQAYKPS
jgi:negative regulator of flagellin synthesis FlgM